MRGKGRRTRPKMTDGARFQSKVGKNDWNESDYDGGVSWVKRRRRKKKLRPDGVSCLNVMFGCIKFGSNHKHS